MKVILGQDVRKLGHVGDVVKVKDGYARNFLLPRKVAFLATPENISKIEREKAKRIAEHEKTRQEAQVLADKLAKVSCTVTVEVNDLERLYGSVTEAEIIRALHEEGYDIDKKAIVLEKPIEELGIFEVGVKLHPDVIAKVRLWVAKK